MNQLRMNEFGLSESLESTLAQIGALANVTHHTVCSTSGNIYLQDVAQLLLTLKNLAVDAEQYRAEWERIILRQSDVRGQK